MHAIQAKAKELFGLDLRSLALFRIAFSSLILFDLIDRFSDLRAFYTDQGILPRADLIARIPATISLHLSTGTSAGIIALFILQIFCAFFLLIGWRTRLMTCFSWALMASLHARNHLVCGGGDDYLRLLLFWSMFLPLGAVFSVDASLKKSKAPDLQVLSWATFAFFIQNALTYWMAAALKFQEPVWLDGTAAFFALNIFNYSRSTADVFLRYPEALRVVTYATLAFETIGPLLLIFPFKNAKIRTTTVFLFIAMHLGLLSCLYLKNFPWVSMSAMLAFLPAFFWKDVTWRFPDLSRFGESLRRFGYEAASTTTRPAMSVLAAFFLVCILWWNIGNFPVPALPIPVPIRTLCESLGISQRWKMFCPPVKRSGWFVQVGYLRDGSEVDLYREGESVRWGKPPRSTLHKNERWRRFMKNFLFGKNKQFWPSYGRYLCRTWNTKHSREKGIKSLEIVAVERTTVIDQEQGKYQKRMVFHFDCPPPKKIISPKTAKKPVKKALPAPEENFIG